MTQKFGKNIKRLMCIKTLGQRCTNIGGSVLYHWGKGAITLGHMCHNTRGKGDKGKRYIAK